MISRSSTAQCDPLHAWVSRDGQTHLDESHHEQSLHGAIRAQSLLKAPVLREKEQRVVPALLLQHTIVARPLACESQTQTLVDGKRESGPSTLDRWRRHGPKGGASPVGKSVAARESPPMDTAKG